jgi:uncharacterized membrane protein YfcA
MSFFDFVLLIASGLAAGFINAVSGGGAMLTVPALIFIGLPPSVANGTNRVAVAIQNVAALAAYQRLGVANHRLALSLALPATLGSLVGALISIRLDDAQFRTILGIVMLLLIGPVLLEPRLNARAAALQQTSAEGWMLPLLFFALGIYGGLLQIGVGIFILVALSAFGGLDLVLANSVKVTIVLCLTTLALLVFVVDGKVAWGVGLLLAVSNAAGAWLGAYWGVKKGAYWIRVVLIITTVAMSLQLLGVLTWVKTLLHFTTLPPLGHWTMLG